MLYEFRIAYCLITISDHHGIIVHNIYIRENLLLKYYE